MLEKPRVKLEVRERVPVLGPGKTGCQGFLEILTAFNALAGIRLVLEEQAGRDRFREPVGDPSGGAAVRVRLGIDHPAEEMGAAILQRGRGEQVVHPALVLQHEQSHDVARRARVFVTSIWRVRSRRSLVRGSIAPPSW